MKEKYLRIFKEKRFDKINELSKTSDYGDLTSLLVAVVQKPILVN